MDTIAIKYALTFDYTFMKPMKAEKLIVMYPLSTYPAAFERRYNDGHVPMTVEIQVRKTLYVASKIRSGIGQTLAQFHRIAEVYFPSLSELEDCLNSPGGQEAAKHAVRISSGGAPLFLISEAETLVFNKAILHTVKIFGDER